MRGLWATLSSALALVFHAHAWPVAAAVLIEITGLVTMTIRWKLLLRSFGASPRFLDTMLAYSAGVFVCNVTPARTIGGDATRAALIQPRSGSPGKLVAASVVYDRATDAVGILTLAVLAAPTLRHSSSARALAIVVAAVAGVLAVPAARRAVSSRVRRWHDAIVGVEVHSVAAAVGASSIAVWMQDSLRVMLICAAFGVLVSPSQAATLTLVRLVSTIVPVPAGLGVADGAMIGALLWFGVPAQAAAAIAIVERAILYGWSTLLGAGSLALLGGTGLLKTFGKA